MGDFSDFQRGHIVGAHLAGASVYPGAAVSKVWQHTQIMGGHHQLRGIMVENEK